jgi:hypothetical protein
VARSSEPNDLVEGKLLYKTINVLSRRVPAETNMLVTY